MANVAGPAREPAGEPTFLLEGVLTRRDIPPLCGELSVLLRARPAGRVICDASALHTADAVAVEALARLQLTAARHGCRLRLRAPSRALRELLELTGLADVLR